MKKKKWDKMEKVASPSLTTTATGEWREEMEE